MTRLMTIALLAVWCAAAPVFAQVDVSGSWTFNIENPQGTAEREYVLEQDGNTISGNTILGGGRDIPVSGTIDGNDITLSWSVDAQGQAITISASGTVDGSTMSGTLNFGGAGSGSFTASRN